MLEGGKMILLQPSPHHPNMKDPPPPMHLLKPWSPGPHNRAPFFGIYPDIRVGHEAPGAYTAAENGREKDNEHHGVGARVTHPILLEVRAGLLFER